jgi:hypothetical protein
VEAWIKLLAADVRIVVRVVKKIRDIIVIIGISQKAPYLAKEHYLGQNSVNSTIG